MRHITRADRVSSNVAVRHRQLHRSRGGLKATRVDLEVDVELLEVGVGGLQAELSGDRDGAGERTEPVHGLLLDGLGPIDDARGDARFARPKKRAECESKPHDTRLAPISPRVSQVLESLLLLPLLLQLITQQVVNCINMIVAPLVHRLRYDVGREAGNLHHVVDHHRVEILGVGLARQRVVELRQIDEIVAREPLVLGDLLQRVAPLRFNDQHVADQMFALLRHEERNPKLSADDDAAQVVEGRTVERQCAAHQHVEHDAEAPDVGARTVIFEALEHLGSGIRRGSAESLQINALGECVAKAEVGELQKESDESSSSVK